MIYSMTGFGRGRATRNGIEATVEIRSVNKRHIDVLVQMPDALLSKESDLQTRIKQTFERGQFKVYVEADQAESTVPLEVDPERAARYRELLERLQAAAQLSGPIQLDHLLQFEDVFVEADLSEDELAEDAWPAVSDALDDALDALATMRAQEGRALRTDLAGRIDAIETALDAVEARAPERVAERQSRLQDRLTELLNDDRVDPDRIETEIAILADKLDVTEECVRLRSHLVQFREALEDDEPTGRKLKFITQEIHREVNTIGAKANDEAISRRTVAMKEEVEKIREQIRNVE